MSKINDLYALISAPGYAGSKTFNSVTQKLKEKALPDADYQVLATLFCVLSLSGTAFHPLMIDYMMKSKFFSLACDEFIDIINSTDESLLLNENTSLFRNAKNLNSALLEAVNDYEVYINFDQEADPKDVNNRVKRLTTLLSNNMATLFNQKKSFNAITPGPPLDISVNFVWIKLSKEIFPNLTLDKPYVTNGKAEFSELIPKKNLDLLCKWRDIYTDKRITVWLDSRLLSSGEYKELYQGLSSLGVNVRDISVVYGEDTELKEIPHIMEQFSKNEIKANLGYVIDLIKFKAAFHFAQQYKGKKRFVYIHSDFDYEPISLDYIKMNTQELGFKTSWQHDSGRFIENDFFMIYDTHDKIYQEILAKMNAAHQTIIKESHYKDRGTDVLFREAYSDIIVEIYKQLQKLGELLKLNRELDLIKNKSDGGRSWTQ